MICTTCEQYRLAAEAEAKYADQMRQERDQLAEQLRQANGQIRQLEGGMRTVRSRMDELTAVLRQAAQRMGITND